VRRILAPALLAAGLWPLVAAGAGAAEPGFFSGGRAPQGKATSADLDAAEGALLDVWARVPFGARHVTFVDKRPELFGGYEPRPSNVFAIGERLQTYLEPVGYGWKSLGNDSYRFGVTTDFELRTRGGKIIGGQTAFQAIDLTSHAKNRELFVLLTLTIDGLEPGDYVVAYTLHDNVGGAAARIEQPFTLVRPS
jgi:hypothetical protein